MIYFFCQQGELVHEYYYDHDVVWDFRTVTVRVNDRSPWYNKDPNTVFENRDIKLQLGCNAPWHKHDYNTN